MAQEKPLSFDFTDFNNKFYKIVKDTIPDLAEEGIFNGGSLLIRDAILEEPRAPHKTGHLWRSQLIEVIKGERKVIGARVGFNVSYAAKLHEAPYALNWTLEGSGPKYLEAKLYMFKDKYIKHAADHIRKNQK